MSTRKNRTFELRLALLDKGRSESEGDRRPIAGGGRTRTRLTAVSRRKSVTSSRPPQNSSSSGGRRRPHRLPELEETGPSTNEELATIKITNLQFGKDSNDPLPPITPVEEIDPDYNTPRYKKVNQPVLPLDIIIGKEKRLREELHSEKCLTDPALEVLSLQELGDLSIQKMFHDKDPVHAVNAAAMYNVALLKTSDDDQKIRIRSRLLEAERQLLQNSSTCSSLVIDKYVAMDTGARDYQKLCQIRQEVRDRIQIVESTLQDGCQEASAPSEDNIALLIREMTEICQSVQDATLDLLSHMVATCKAILGEAPCQYAILAVGPLASYRGNPFHMPLELIVLIANDKCPANIKYFHNFFHYMHLKILNLGESPLSVSGVKMLLDEYIECMLSFHDDKPLAGLYLDFRPFSNHISPLITTTGDGFKRFTEEDEATFIGSPWRIASLLRKENIDRLGYQTVSKLLHFVKIDGDIRIVDKYAKEIDAILNEEHLARKYRVTYACDWLISRHHTSEFNTIRNNGLSTLHMQLLHRELELIHDILDALMIHNQLSDGSAKNIIDQLVENNLIAKEKAESLLLCWTVSCYFGLKAKMSCFERAVAQKDEQTSNKFLFTNWMVINYYQSLLPCWTFLYESAISYHTLSLAECSLSHDAYKVKALALQRLDEYSLAIQLLRKELEEVPSMPNKTLSALVSHKIHSLIGLLSLVKGDLKESGRNLFKAMDYQEIIAAKEAKPRAFLDTWHNFGLLHMFKGKLDKALEQLSDCISLSQQVLKEHPKERDCFEAGVNENLGRTQALLGNIGGALKSFHMALRLRESGRKIYMNCEALRYINHKMGHINHTLGNGKEALNCLFDSLKCHLKIRSTNDLDIWDAMILRDICFAYELMGKLSLAANYRLQVKKICLNIYLSLSHGESLCQKCNEYLEMKPLQHVVMLYQLGNCLLYAKEHNLATEIFQILESFLNHTKNNQLQCFFEVDSAELAYARGQTSFELGEMKNAEICFRVSLDILSKIYAVNAMRTYHIAKCHKGLGATLIELKKYEEAMKHIDIASEYFSFTNEENEVHIDMCEILSMKAVAKRAMGNFSGSHMDLQECLRVEQKIVGPAHVWIARCITEIGITYSMEGLYESAMKSFEEAMSMYRRVDVGCDKHLGDIPRLYVYRAKCNIAVGRIPQAERCWERAASKGMSILQRHPSKLNVFIHFLCERANFYHQIERPDEAIPIRRKIIDLLRENGRAENDPEVLSLWFAIGKDYNAAGNVEEATRTMAKAIQHKRSETMTKDESLVLASWLCQLSQIYAKIGESKKSSECFLDSLYLKKKFLGAGAVDDNVIMALETIAELQETRGEFRQAVALIKQSLKAFQSQEKKPRLLGTLERLARAYQHLGEHGSALLYWQDALELQVGRDSDKGHNAHLASIHRKCGQCLDGLKRHERAIEHYKKCLHLLRNCGDQSVRYCTSALTTGEIGKALYNLGRSQEAGEYLEKAVSVLKSIDQDAECRDQLASVLLHLGLIYDTYGRVNEAKDCFMKSLSHKKNINGTNDSERVQVLRALSRVSYDSGDYKQGISYLEEALKNLQTHLGEDEASLLVASLLEDIGSGYTHLGETSKALQRTTEALQMLRRHFGHKRSCLHIARCLSSLAAICFKADRKDDTIAYAKQALSTYVATLPDNADHPEMVVLNTILGDCYCRMKKYEDSLIHYKKASQISLYLHNGDSMHADVVNLMGKLHEAQKRFGVYT